MAWLSQFPWFSVASLVSVLAVVTVVLFAIFRKLWTVINMVLNGAVHKSTK
jgi:uncharacterized membrane protein